MSTPPRKPSVATTTRPSEGRRSSALASDSPSSRTASPSRVLSAQGTARQSMSRETSYVARPNKASVQSRRPSSIIGSIGNVEDVAKEENARIENAQLIENLKKSLKTSDVMAEERQAQFEVLQKKYDELLKDHGKLEEQFGDTTQKLGELEAKRKDDSRSVREMANLYESERISMLRDREEAAQREEELRRSIQRLKETMAGREMRMNIGADSDRRLSRSATRGRSDDRSGSVDDKSRFAPPNGMQRRGSSIHRSDSQSQNTSRLVMQKDVLIESLRLELAEAQIKLVEMENMGGNHMQEIERQLLETRMANARLMEDNESFQLLLGEKSLNGDIMKTDLIQGAPTNGSGLSSLAEELESAEGESERTRRLEQELKSIREEKKALTLYIEKIISRVLQHENFEGILDQRPGARDGQAPLPPPKDDFDKPSVVQRAMSVVGARKRPTSQLITGSAASNLQQDIAATSKPRPQSHIFSTPTPHVPSAHEDPALAPSIPLARTTSITRAQRHRRTQSTQSVQSIEIPGAAAVINQMFQGNEAGPISPVSPGTTIPRANYFNGTALRDTSSTPSRSMAKRSSSAQHSNLRETEESTSRPTSRHSNEVPSPPRNSAGNTVFTGAVMTQNKLRPLRLVQQKKDDDIERARQEAAEEEALRKKANRGSWMPGWLTRGAETPRTPTAAGQE